jgi:cell wall-associated NlpC family hydrolase
LVFNTPGIAGDIPVQLMCAHAAYDLATDTDGADITLLAPVDPPVQPPQAANANKSDTSSGTLTSGGGADGQIDRFVAIALQQAGKRYVFGAEASPSDPNPKAFDCSELVEWAAARAGITPKVPDGSAAQQSWCASHKTLISAATAINTKGALLFMPGHVAISLGNGKTIEAMNPSQGVRQGNAAGRGWTSAGRIPGAAGYR